MSGRVTLVMAVGWGGEVGVSRPGPAHHRGLPWGLLREDLAHFARVTRGLDVIVGRRTAELLPYLADRRVRVLTGRPRAFDRPLRSNEYVHGSLADALGACGEHAAVIGGASVFEEAAPLATHVWLTRVRSRCPDADVRLDVPALLGRGWRVLDWWSGTRDPIRVAHLERVGRGGSAPLFVEEGGWL